MIISQLKEKITSILESHQDASLNGSLEAEFSKLQTEKELINFYRMINTNNTDGEFYLEVDLLDNDGKITGEKAVHTRLSLDDYLYCRFCYASCPEISRFPLVIKGKNAEIPLGILTNECQSGKTRAYMYYLALAVRFGFNVIVIAQNDTSQYHQFMASIKYTEEILFKAGIEYGFAMHEFSVVYAGNKPNMINLVENYWIKGGSITIALDNVHQLTRIAETLESFSSALPGHITIVDEGDVVLKRCRKKQIPSLRDTELKKIVDRADIVISITATPMAHFLQDEREVFKKYVVKGSIPENYVGINNDKIMFIPVIDSTHGIRVVTVNNYGIFEPEDYFLECIQHFAELPPRMTGEPHDLLINISDFIADHRAIRNWLSTEYDEWPSLINNSDMIEFYYPYEDIDLSDWKFAGYKHHEKLHTWKSVNYPELKTKLLNLLKPKDSVYFVEIVGRRADRSIRFRTANNTWSPSAILFMASDKVSYDDAYQAIGRIFGLQNGDLDRKYYYTSEVINDILRSGFSVTNKMVTYSGDVQTMDEICATIDLEQDEYNTKLTKHFTLREQKDRTRSQVIERADQVGDADVIPPEEYRRLVTKMFPKWKQEDTRIGTFMRRLDPTREYTHMEFAELRKETQICGLLYKEPNRQNYGQIIQRIAGKYRLYTELIDAYTQIFLD